MLDEGERARGRSGHGQADRQADGRTEAETERGWAGRGSEGRVSQGVARHTRDKTKKKMSQEVLL